VVVYNQLEVQFW